MDFAVLVDHRVKLKEREKRDKYQNKARKLKIWNKGDSDINCNCCAQYSHQMLGKGTGRPGNKRTIGNYSIIEIGQNTRKSPEDLRRLSVTETPMGDHQLTLVWKTLNEVK